MSDRRFEELREGIKKELFKANQHFKIYWELYSAPNGIANIRNEYLTYFYYSMWAHGDCFCISIYNITKYNPRTSNLPRLLNHISKNDALKQLYSRSEISDMRTILKSHEDLINRMNIARNQYIAHNPLCKSHLDIKLEYCQAEGEKLLNDLKSMVNTLSDRYDSNIFLFDASPQLNVGQLLSDLMEHKQKRINERKRLIIK